MSTTTIPEPLIKMLNDLTPKEISAVRQRLQSMERKNMEQQMIAETESHAKFVGRCYTRRAKTFWGETVKRYYKIVSERASNELHMTVLTFPESPQCRFECRLSKVGMAGDGYFGNFELESIEVEDIGFFCNDYHPGDGQFRKVIDAFEEITPEEYERAMNAFLEQLKKLEFIADRKTVAAGADREYESRT